MAHAADLQNTLLLGYHDAGKREREKQRKTNIKNTHSWIIVFEPLSGERKTGGRERLSRGQTDYVMARGLLSIPLYTYYKNNTRFPQTQGAMRRRGALRPRLAVHLLLFHLLFHLLNVFLVLLLPLLYSILPLHWHPCLHYFLLLYLFTVLSASYSLAGEYLWRERVLKSSVCRSTRVCLKSIKRTRWKGRIMRRDGVI